MKAKLTSAFVEAAAAEGGRRLEVYDQHPLAAGLVLRVTPGGGKTWSLRYRTADGHQRRFLLGEFPAVSLAEARDRAVAARKEVRDERDPAGERRLRRAEAKAQPLKTMDDLATAYFQACETGEWRPRRRRIRASTTAYRRWLSAKYVEPRLGDLRLEDVTAASIKAVLRPIVAAGHGVTANRTLGLIGQMFNFAIAEGRAAANPTRDVEPMGDERPRDRVLDDDELKEVWKAITDPTGLKKPRKGKPKGVNVFISPGVRLALKLCALLAARRGEVAGMTWDELDLDNKLWTIPGQRTKNGVQHVIPLSNDAVDLLRKAKKGAGDPRSGPVFPSRASKETSITPGALTHALRDVRLALDLDRLSPHDLRRTAATLMASERLGVSPFIIGRVLNHTTETGGAAMVTLRTYALHDYAPEKRAALEKWGHLLMHIVGERPLPAKVTHIRPKANKRGNDR